MSEMNYLLMGKAHGILVFEEFSSIEGAHSRWDELRSTDDNCQLKIKESCRKPVPRLNEKLFAISKAVGKIEKNGVAENKDLDGKPLYLYAKAEDIFDRMVPLLEKHKLLLTGSVLKDPLSHVVRGGSSTTEVLVEWTLEDVVTKESRTWRIPGTGTEELGLYKALTGSRKQFYILVFNLRIGDDPESLPERKEVDAPRSKKGQPANDQSSIS